MRRIRNASPCARRALVAMLLVGLATAGCVQIPTTGPVRYAKPRAESRPSPPVRVIAAAPRPGDTPSQIVHGFIEAMRSYQAGFPVARKFLAPSVRESWDPATVRVYDGTDGLSVSMSKTGRVRVQAPQVGEIRADGSWRSEPGDTPLRIGLRLAKVHGEWRITNPPNTLVMSREDVDREYGRYELYYFDPEFVVLVPDPVYLPVRGNIATLLVQKLLRGPSTWLGPVVRTTFPTRTQLATPSVPVQGDLAQVDLNRRVLDLSETQRRLMVAQLAWTLQQAGVQRVRITVDQAPLTIGGKPAVGMVDHWQRYDPAVADASSMAVAVQDHEALVVGSVRLDRLDGPLGDGRVEVRSVAVSIFGNRLAAVSADGRRVVVAETPTASSGQPAAKSRPRVVARGRDFAKPSWDRTGTLWLVDRAEHSGRIEVVDERQRVHRLDAPELQGKDIVALAVAHDGARLAALVTEHGRTHLEVARIRRDPDLVVDGVHEVPLPLTTMTDLAWSDVDQLTVIGHGRGKPPTAFEVSSDGSMMTELSGAPTPRSVAAAPGLPLVLGGLDGRIYTENEQYRWTDLGPGRNPAYPG